MTWSGVIDTGYRDPLVVRDDFPEDHPTAWDECDEFVCGACGEWWLDDDQSCPTCGKQWAR